MEQPAPAQQAAAAAATSAQEQPAQEQQQQQQPADAAAEPLPLPYQLDGDGRKAPLPGAKSLFLRSATLEAFGLAQLGRASGQLTAPLARERLLADVQFQGAISDFHCAKDAIKACDYDPLIARVNEEDAFGDGNNFQLAVTRAAAGDEDDAGGDGSGGVPRAKRRREPRPWQDLGSEAELEAAGIPSHKGDVSSSTSAGASGGAGSRPASSTLRTGGSAGARGMPTGLLLSRPRRAFGAPLALSDASASELWASNTMEARPFRDAAFDLKRATLEAAAQAVPQLRSAAVQATGCRPRGCSCQTAPQTLPQEQLEALMAAPGFAAFLDAVQPRLHEALLQNSIADVLADDLAQLGDEDSEGLPSSSGGGASPSRAPAAAGGSGRRQEHGGLTEAQSFTDLTYSRHKVVSAICWVPNRRGVVAAAVTDPASQTARLASMGRLVPAHILVWNVRDPIHPECVLESPHEVTAFQYNPVNPDIIVGGCFNGQVVVWDLGSTAAASSSGAAAAASGGGGRGKGAGGSGGSGGWEEPEADAVTPVIPHKYLSAVEHSHTAAVCDVCWLPGLEVDRAGKVFTVRGNSAGTSAQSLLRSMTLGAAALAAAAAGSTVPREACFFASIAPDGKVMFWDVRLDKLLKKGTKRLDDAELCWRPMHTVALLSVAGNDFAGSAFTFDPLRLDSANFTAGSLDGELLAGNFARPPGDKHPDYARLVFAPHAGPVVALAPSPFLPDLLLSVGDWTFRLWQASLDSTVPLFTSPYADEAYTAAAWSPSRPGLLFLATAGGLLQVWDLLDRSHEPSLTLRASNAAVTSLAFSNAPPKHATLAPADAAAAAADCTAAAAAVGLASGTPASAAAADAAAAAAAGASTAPPAPGPGAGLQVLAVGDAAGVLHLFELPRTLRRPLPNERRLMAGFVAREAARVADVAARQALRAAALADAKRLEEARHGDSSNAADQQQLAGSAQLSASGARTSTIASSQAGTLAAPPAPVLASTAGASASGASGAADKAAAAQAAEAAKAEAAYRALEAEFREQLGLPPASPQPGGPGR